MEVNIANEGLITTLRVSMWSGRLHDKEATDMVAKSARAGNGAGRYNKRLAAKDFTAPLQKTASEARQEHYKLTLPWSYGDNERLLPMQAQEDYEAAMEELRETFLRQRREFVGKYDEMLDEARKRLGTLFHADEYPDPQRLGLSFRFGWVYKPIPRSEDVTVPMTQERLDQLRESIEANVQQAVAGAVEDLYRRLHEVVGHVADRLTVDDKGDALVFRNGLIDNVREVVELMPKLNVTNDKRLIAVAKEVEKRLLVIDNPAELRPTAPQYRPEKRKAIKAAADDLAVRLAGFFGDQAMPNAA